MPPDGVIKTRIAFEQLIGHGIGDTVRVSLDRSQHRKGEEIEAGRGIIADIYAGVSAVSSISIPIHLTSFPVPVARAWKTKPSSTWPKKSKR